MYIYMYIYIYIFIIYEAFITIKDQKPNFPKNVACCLLNPCKSEIGKVRKYKQLN